MYQCENLVICHIYGYIYKCTELYKTIMNTTLKSLLVVLDVVTKLLVLFICMFRLQGYKMDDLLTSYISLMLTTMNKNRSMRRQ